MAGILGEKGIKTIARKIRQWGNEDINSIREMPGFNGASIEDIMNPEKFPAKSKEHLLARQSMPDLMYGTSSEAYLDNEGNEIESKVNEEVIAYFLQHADRQGIKPSHTTVIGRILQKFRKAFRDFMGYAKEETDSLTAQSLADMAIGSARIQMGSKVALDPATKKLLLQARREGLTEESTNESELYARTWNEKIEAKIRRELPKNDKGKYIPEGGAYLAREDWIKFQISQGREEKRLRLVLEAHVADLMKDAAQHEGDMGGPDGTLYATRRPNLNEEEKKRSKDEADRVEKHVEKHFNADMKSMWTTMKDLATKGGRKLEFLHDQIYRNRKEMPAGVVVGDNLLAAESLRNEIKQTAEAVAVQARNLNPARTYLVNKAIAYGTIEGLWPADPDTENVSVAEGNVTIDKGFQKLFEKELTKSEQKIVMDVYRHGIHLLAEYTKHLEAAVGKTASKGILKLLATKGPYAALRRTGNHTVTLKSKKLVAAQQRLEKGSTSKERLKNIEAEYNKLRGDSNHYIYTHFLNEGEAGRFMDEEKKTGNWAPDDDSVEVKYRGMRYQEKPPAIGAGRESDFKVLEKVYGALATSGLEKDTRALVENLVEGLFLDSLEETNARQAMTRREGIAGYDENMLRSFVSNAKSQANLIANLAYGKAINVALSKAWKESIDHPNDRTSKLYKELVFHYNLMLSGKDTNIQDSIASFTTAWMLTLNPSYHLQNLSQPWAVSYPILAATFNDWKGVAPRLAEGYAIAQSIISYDGKVPFLSLKKAQNVGRNY